MSGFVVGLDINSGFWQQAGSGASPTAPTITFGDALLDGDLLFAMFASSAGPTTAWTTPSGWTLAGSQKNGTNSIGGRAALFYKVWRTGDSKTVSSSGPTGNYSTIGMVVRSDTDGATLTHGNPPASGYGGTYDAETTASGTSITMPRMNVADTKNDLRLYFIIAASSNISTVTPASVTPNANNVFGARAIATAKQSNVTICSGTAVGTASDSAGIEAGTQTWTAPTSGKFYVIGVVVHDPNASDAGGPWAEEKSVDRLNDDLLCTGLEHIVTVTNTGGGGSITVF